MPTLIDDRAVLAKEVSRGSMLAALRLALWFALAKLLFQFALTLWTTHLGYSYFRDEFYFLACGRHLAWGYVDQGPIVALQARLTTLLFGDSVFGIRILSASAGGIAVGLCGLLTWALGGQRAAQALAMLGLLLAPVYIAVDGFLSITCFEPVFWMGCVLALLLLQQGASPRGCWLTIGVCAGLGLLNKPSMLFFLLALVLALLVTPERRLLRTRWAAIAAVIALLLVAPFLAWEARHGWATWVFLRNGQLGNKVRILGPVAFVWQQIAQMQPVNALLWIPGLVATLRGRTLTGMRWIGLTYLLFLTLMYAMHAKDYYLAPVYPMLLAAGGVAWERRLNRSPSDSRLFAFPVYETVLVVTGLLILPTASPVLRPHTWARYTHALHLNGSESENARTSMLPRFFADRFGWNQMASIVVTAYRSLPPEEQRHACIFASNYGEAASLEFLGSRLTPGLPPVISGHNNYWLWGQRGCSGEVVIAVVNDDPSDLLKKYTSVTVVGHTSGPLAMPYEHKNIYLLRGRRPDVPISWEDERAYI